MHFLIFLLVIIYHRVSHTACLVDCNVSNGSLDVFQGPKTREGEYYPKWIDVSEALQQLYNNIADALLSDI